MSENPDTEFNKHVKVLTNIKNVPKHTFVMFFWETCGPCIATKPLWAKTAEIVNKQKNAEILICAIESKHAHKVNPQISGYPTLCYYLNGKLQQGDNFTGERSVENFKKWIESKTGRAVAKKGGKKRKHFTKKSPKKSRTARKTRKWFFF